MRGRTPPAAIARQLRQEAGFGCAVCGCPIIEYHHIIEWREEKHFKPEHMVALCPSHHTEYGKLPKTKSYSAKANPINIRKGKISGYLGGNREQRVLRLGSMIVEDCVSAIDYGGNSIIGYQQIDGEFRLNVFIPDEEFWPEVEIKQNIMAASIGQFWDIEFKTNWVKFRRAKGNVFLTIDFRGEEVEIDGELQLGGNLISLSEAQNRMGGGTFKNIQMRNCHTAIAIGPDGRVFHPNYAMRSPQAWYLPRKA